MSYYHETARFLLNTTPQTERGFAGTDSRTLFNQSLATKPHDWHYRTKQVDYVRNSSGYRTQEFQSIDWGRSIVIFGCSNVFGIGLAEDETLSHNIQVASGFTTVNMGIGGGSNYHTLYNLLCMTESGQRPLAVVNSWTETSRLIYFGSDFASSVGSWSSDYHQDFFKVFNAHETNTLAYSVLLKRLIKVLLTGIPCYEFSYFYDASQELGVDYHRTLDRARDCVHPGPATAKRSAQIILDNLDL